jgi:hypothetical protein
MRTTDDSGFTLPELLISMLLYVLIIGAFAALSVSVLHNADSTRVRTDEARGRGLTSLYFVADANSATSTSTTTRGCATSAALPSLVVNFSWNDVDSKLHSVDYGTFSSTDDGTPNRVLHRWECIGGSVTHDSVLDERVSRTSPPSLTCYGSLSLLSLVTCSATPPSIAMTVAQLSGSSYTIYSDRRSAP